MKIEKKQILKIPKKHFADTVGIYCHIWQYTVLFVAEDSMIRSYPYQLC
jgi:hypothetical protein